MVHFLGHPVYVIEIAVFYYLLRFRTLASKINPVVRAARWHFYGFEFLNRAENESAQKHNINEKTFG